MTEDEKEKYCYLGDGVYAYFDNYGVWLRTGHHEESECQDKIYLEPSALNKLNKWFAGFNKEQ